MLSSCRVDDHTPSKMSTGNESKHMSSITRRRIAAVILVMRVMSRVPRAKRVNPVDSEEVKDWNGFGRSGPVSVPTILSYSLIDTS